MSYENKKLARANELFTTIKNAEAELEALFAESQQPKRGRPRKDQNGAGDSRSMETNDADGANPAANDPT